MNKVLFGISFIGLIFSSAFMIVSIWNTEWMLLERGYYTFGIITVGVVTYLSVQLLLSAKYADNLGRLNLAICGVFTVIAIIFMGISIRNTQWILLEKGYYWLGLGFVAITSAMVASTISSVMLPSPIHDEHER